MKLRIKIAYPFGWVLLAVLLTIADFAVWLIWREQWHNGLHDTILAAIGLVGFKMFYELGRAERKHEQRTLRPGRRYHIVGPDGAWMMVGLSTGPDGHGRGQAVVTFVDEADYEARFAQKAFRP